MRKILAHAWFWGSSVWNVFNFLASATTLLGDLQGYWDTYMMGFSSVALISLAASTVAMAFLTFPTWKTWAKVGDTTSPGGATMPDEKYIIDQSINASNNKGSISQVNNNFLGPMRTVPSEGLKRNIVEIAKTLDFLNVIIVGGAQNQKIAFELIEHLRAAGVNIKSVDQTDLRVPTPPGPYSFMLNEEKTHGTLTISPETQVQA